MCPNHSRLNRSRRSRPCPSQDDSLPGNRQRPVQKAVQYISAERFPTWAERWISPPPHRKSDKTSSNTRPSVVGFEHEFKLDFPPTPLTPDGDASIDSHSGRPTKKRKRRTRKGAPYPASSLQPRSASTQASTEEPGLDTPTSGLFSPSLQAESVATSSTLSGGSLTPDSEVAFYPDHQVYADRNPLIPAYNHQHEGNLAQRGSPILPYGASTIYHYPVIPFPDTHTILRWMPEDGASYSSPIPQSYYRHDPDGHHQSLDAMGRGTFLGYDPRLPHWSEPYIQPRGETLHQSQAYDTDAPDEHIPFAYNHEDTRS